MGITSLASSLVDTGFESIAGDSMRPFLIRQKTNKGTYNSMTGMQENVSYSDHPIRKGLFESFGSTISSDENKQFVKVNTTTRTRIFVRFNELPDGFPTNNVEDETIFTDWKVITYKKDNVTFDEQFTINGLRKADPLGLTVYILLDLTKNIDLVGTEIPAGHFTLLTEGNDDYVWENNTVQAWPDA